MMMVSRFVWGVWIMTEVIEEGVVLELNGKFWGKCYEDGRSTSYGWVDIKKAEISNPEYCKKPSDKTYTGSHYIDEMNKGKLINIKRITSYEIIDEKKDKTGAN